MADALNTGKFFLLDFTYFEFLVNQSLYDGTFSHDNSICQGGRVCQEVLGNF